MSGATQRPWRLDPLGLHIFADNAPKGPMYVAEIRGWGYLTGMGHGALGLSKDEAIAIQRANGELIVQAVNSYDDLIAALEKAEEFIAWDMEATGTAPDWHEQAADVVKIIRSVISKAQAPHIDPAGTVSA